LFFKPILRYTALLITLFIAIVLSGSPSVLPISRLQNSKSIDAIEKENSRIMYSVYPAGHYAEAHEEFLRVAQKAEQLGLTAQAIGALNNAGVSSIARLRFRDALGELLRSHDIAERSGKHEIAAQASNNIASLYSQMGNFDAALRIATEAASEKPAPTPSTAARLDAQRAIALSNLHRLDEARALFASAISTLDDLGLWDPEVRTRGMYGRQLVEAGDLDTAEQVLVEALRLARIHRVGAANVLRALALLRAAQNDGKDASRLFDAALAEPPGPTPRWMIFADRGEFRLDQNDPAGALNDFLEARRLAAEMRADIVPADEDRVTLEAGLGRIAAGIVNANNQIALYSGDGSGGRARLENSFDIAEQDRQWSLRAIVPTPDDWRTRLPAEYWDLLAQYQALERSLGSAASGRAAERAGAIALKLQFIEARTGGAAQTGRVLSSGGTPAALEKAQKSIPNDSVLFSFYITKRKAWLWAITSERFDVYPIASGAWLQASIEAFVSSLRSESPEAASHGRELYKALFGAVEARYTDRPKWLLELDGPLYNVPFPALVTSPAGQPPVWLVERVSTRSVPGALLMEERPATLSGPFVGIADPVYNAADARYTGRKWRSESVLTRLPNTDREVRSCARAWDAPESHLLTGMNANTESVERIFQTNPSIIHFATHVVPGSGDYGSGLIALSLNRRGALGLLGPRQILARPVTANLVVLDGCDSAQGSALPAAGLMGLTRAWIGSGAHAVLATLWDIPDNAQSALPAFYRHLRANEDLGPAAALRAAQLDMLKGNPQVPPAEWAGYFLLTRR
jgi:CHAT domain-containing protein/tetratricopeptide (TPR) repeat protein